ncbi:MAG: Yip1 family protein [Pyrinomonadaceae bacterium]
MDENNLSEPQAPKPPDIPVDPPQMSEISTIANVFFDPGETFKDLKRKPRFIIAGIIIALLVGVYTYAINVKVGEAGMRSFIAEQIDKGPGAGNMTPEQKSGAIEMQMSISKYTRYAVPVFVFISFFIGALLYWLGSKAFGGSGGYMQNLSVWVYSGLPPVIVGMLGNLIVLALKSADDIDLAASQRGLLNANPAFFIDGKSMPMIATFLSTFDLFAIWGWILAAIGLGTVNKMSKGASWGLVIIIVIIGLAFRMIGAMFSGNPS